MNSITKKVNRYIKEKNKRIKNLQNNQFFYAYALQENDDNSLIIKKKLKCKYRKSCYYNENYKFETKNKTPSIITTQKILNENDDNIIDENKLKKICKYRHSCYVKKGFEKKNKKQTSIYTSKSQHLVKPKIKDIANDAIKKLEMKKKQVINKPKNSKAKIFLNSIKKEKKNKNDCKYRKSCYKTGILPKIEESKWIIKLKQLFKIDNNLNKKFQDKKFDELSTNEKKIFCKYRKSCYKSGIPEKITVKTKLTNITPKKVPLKEICKYRKSCYENGIYIDKSNKKVETQKKNILNLNTLNFKQYCKYRKSCYIAIREKNNTEVQKIAEKIKIPKKEILTIQKNNESLNINYFKIKNETINVDNIKTQKTTEKFRNKMDKKLEKTTDTIEVKKIKIKQSTKNKKIEDVEKKTITPKSRPIKKYKKMPKEIQKKKNEKTIPETVEEIVESEKLENKINLLKKNQESTDNIEELENASEMLNVPQINEIENVDLNLKVEDKLNYTNDSSVDKYELKINNDIIEIKNNQKENEWANLNKIEKIKCKYRKSCYENQIVKINFNENQILSNISTKETFENKQNIKALNNTHNAHMNRNEKQKCKYRNSCYLDNTSVEVSKNLTDKHILINQNIIKDKYRPVLILPNGKTCSKYRVTCRQQVGLPPIERHPIAKNGKKLCRKNKQKIFF